MKKDAPNKDTIRKKLWAKLAYKRLMTELGNRCNHCGTTENLQFDCIIPQGDEHHRKNTIGRIQFYRKQHFTFSNIQILCEKCNGKKSVIEREQQYQFESNIDWDTPAELANYNPF